MPRKNSAAYPESWLRRRIKTKKTFYVIGILCKMSNLDACMVYRNYKKYAAKTTILKWYMNLAHFMKKRFLYMLRGDWKATFCPLFASFIALLNFLERYDPLLYFFKLLQYDLTTSFKHGNITSPDLLYMTKC